MEKVLFLTSDVVRVAPLSRNFIVQCIEVHFPFKMPVSIKAMIPFSKRCIILPPPWSSQQTNECNVYLKLLVATTAGLG